MKFDEVVTPFGSKENSVDQRIKVNESKFLILVLFVDGILLASNNTKLFHVQNGCFYEAFETKDIGETSFVVSVEIL